MVLTPTRLVGFAFILLFSVASIGCGGGENQTIQATEDEIAQYEAGLGEGEGEGGGEEAKP